MATLLMCVRAAAQCTVTATSNPKKNYCGNPFYPIAKGDAGKYIVTFENNFNNKSLGSGWASSTDVSFENPCGSANGSPTAWMVGGSDRNRGISTVDFDVSKGGKICFDLKFAEVNGTNQAPVNCEAPDQPYEGVYIQYSTDGGNTWNDIFYFDPSPFPQTQYTSWNNYCFNIPEDAVTPTTRFRWFQAEASGPDVDHWGIDNVQILTNDPNYEYIWDHTTVKSAEPGYHVPPTTPFTYHVTYRHKITGQECDASFTVTSILPQVVVSPQAATACVGTPLQLSAQYVYPSEISTCGIQTNGCMGTPALKTVGTPVDTSYLVFNNASQGSGKSQFIIRKGELNLQDGQIGSLGISAFDNGFANRTYYSFTIKIGCTDQEEYSTGNFITGLTTVYTRGSETFKNGANTIEFDNYYDYDANKNLVIEICWSNITLRGNLPLRGNKMSWRAGNVVNGPTTSTTNCGKANGGTNTTFRPVFEVGYCTPVISSNLSYSWTPSGGLNSATIKNPTATLQNSATYTAQVTDLDYPVCTAKNSTSITISTVNPGRDTALVLCKTTGTINLFSYLRGNPQTGGTWKDPAGNTSASSVNTNTASPGTYTYNISDPNCGLATSKVTLTFETPPNPGLPKDSTVCNTRSAISLFPILLGGPQSGGTWSSSNAAAALSGGVFDATKVTPGAYRFTYTLAATAICPGNSTTITITVVAPPNPGIPTTATVCNSAGTVDLFKLLNGSPQAGGSWTNTNNAGTISGNILNISGVANGTYKYTYTLPATAFCAGASTVLTITVVEQPVAGNNGSTTICQTVPSVNLFTVLTGSPDGGGKWSDLSATGKMSAEGVLTVTGLLPGTYNFRYTMDVAGCPKSEATATVTVVRQNYAGTGRDTTLCATAPLNLFNLVSGNSTGGTWTDLTGTGAFSGSTFNCQLVPASSYSFRYAVTSVSPCVNQNTTVTVTTVLPSKAGSGKSLSICQGETRFLAQDIIGTPTGAGSWSSVPALTGLNANSGELNTTAASVGVYRVKFVVPGTAPCPNDTASFLVTINEKPKAANVTYFCTNQNRQYYVEFEVYRGQSTTYTFTPAGTKIPGTPYRFRSNPITSKTSQTFYIDDANKCGPDSITVFFDCGCVTQAGTTGKDTLKVCENAAARAIYTPDFVNDGNDTSLFVLHEGAGGTIVNAKQYNSIPEFTFGTGMVYGKVYYISAIAADKGSFNGFNPADTCLDVSPGTPVIFNAVPEVTHSQNSPLCQGDSVIISLKFNKSAPPYRLFYTYGTATSRIFNTDTGVIKFVADSTRDFVLTSVAAQGCSSSFNRVEKIVVDDSIRLSALRYSCNADNNAFTLSFDISKGKPGAYVVSGLNGSLNGSTFTSVSLPSPSSFNVMISDGSTCPPKTITGNYICPCITNAGSMANTVLIKVCGTDTATAQFRNNALLDGNDRQYFILHTNAGKPSDIKKISTTPQFTYDPSLVYGVRYYISSVAGDSLNSFIDTTSRCFSISSSVPVEFYPKPSGVISGDTTICQAQPLDLKPILTGFGPYSIGFVDQTGRNYSFPSVNQGDPVIVKPNPGTYILKFSRLRDITSGCTGDTAGSYRIVVIPSPKAVMDGDTVYCDGFGTARIRLSLTGVPPFSGTVTQDNGTTHSFSGVGSYYDYLVSPSVGRNVYHVTSLSDQSPAACPGFSDDSVVVVVNPIPHITMTGGDSVCSGNSAYLRFSVSNVPAGYTGTYSLRITHQQSGSVQTVQFTGTSDSIAVAAANGRNDYFLSSARDVNTGCNAVVSGTGASITVIPLPAAVLSGNSTFCDATVNQVTISLMIQGTGQVKVYYSDSHDNHYVYSNVQSASAYTATHSVPVGNTSFSIDSVIDGSGLNCHGQYSGVANVVVHPLPTAQLTVNGLKSESYCEGQSAWIRMETTGTLPVIVEIEDDQLNSWRDTLTTAVDSIQVIAAAGPHVYRVRFIADNNQPSCSTTGGDQITIIGNPKPVITLNAENDTVCEGELIRLKFNLTQGSVPFEIVYSVDGVTHSPAVILAGNDTTDLLYLPAGLHTFRVESIRDLSSAACPGNPAAIAPTTVLVKQTPVIQSFFSDAPAVCSGASTTVHYTASGSGPLIIGFTSADSTWSEAFNGSGSFSYGPLISGKSIAISSLQYADLPACPGNPTDRISIAVNPLPTARLTTPDTTVCEGDRFALSVALTGSGRVSGTFNYSDGTVYPFASSSGYAAVMADAKTQGYFFFPANSIVDDNGCRNSGTDSVFVTVNPLPVIDFAAYPAESCVPLSTHLVNLTSPQYTGGGCSWNIGQGYLTSTSCDSTPQLILGSSTTMDVSLTVTTSAGCRATLTKPAYLKAHPNPDAQFSYNPNPVYISNTTVNFTDYSSFATAWNWDFGQYGSYTFKNPVVQFPAEPELEIPVRLTVTTPFGCVDSAFDSFKIVGELLVNIPNAFTPNNDDKNEVFIPVIYGLNETSNYEFQIFDRWGELIFETRDPAIGWKGTYKDAPVKNGVYAYRLKVQSRFSKEIREYLGHVSLVK
ncbi:MAG: gliding motility-associated C-terminal domain-containing protein [Bacteroidota bacterium]